MTSVPGILRLRAVTRPLDGMPDLVALADPSQPLLWNRGDRGCVGIGELLRLTFSGPSRFTDAADAWRAMARFAEVDDTVNMPGTGLVALGTFAFADESSAESVLIVPNRIVARHRDTAWVTDITVIPPHMEDSADVAEVDNAGDPARTGDLATTGDLAANSEQPPAVVSLADLPAPAAPGAWNGVEFISAEDDAVARAVVRAYLDGVREAGERIERGEAEKIVLSRQIHGSIAADDDLRVPLMRLAERYLDCWTFAVDGLIGASPETLIRATAGAVSARVLAGTRARHSESDDRDARARDELLTSQKEQHEHAFAVLSVITALSPFVHDLRTSEEPFPLQLPNVWHLATDLGATLGRENSALELVNALHPTAAVAGTPTSTAITSIAELEPFDRGRYSGAVGWIDGAGDGEWVIALRCAQLSPPNSSDDIPIGTAQDGARVSPATRSIIASAGGGIVAGSDPEHELGETVSKLRPVTEAFAR